MRLKIAVSILITGLVGNLWLAAQVQNFRPVTEPTLRNPATGDWLNWRRTDNATRLRRGYVPAESTRRHSGVGRRDGRLALGVSPGTGEGVRGGWRRRQRRPKKHRYL